MSPSTLALNTAHQVLRETRPRSISPARLAFVDDHHPLVQLIATIIDDAIQDAGPDPAADSTLPLPAITPFRELPPPYPLAQKDTLS